VPRPCPSCCTSGEIPCLACGGRLLPRTLYVSADGMVVPLTHIEPTPNHLWEGYRTFTNQQLRTLLPGNSLACDWPPAYETGTYVLIYRFTCFSMVPTVGFTATIQNACADSLGNDPNGTIYPGHGNPRQFLSGMAARSLSAGECDPLNVAWTATGSRGVSTLAHGVGSTFVVYE
jgi:hypothetical protein